MADTSSSSGTGLARGTLTHGIKADVDAIQNKKPTNNGNFTPGVEQVCTSYSFKISKNPGYMLAINAIFGARAH